jgi:hypothetical protein
VDQNDGGTSTGNMTGTYSLGSGGLGSATFTQGGFQSMFFYSVDNSLALFISTDPTQAALGSFELQTTPTNNAHLSVGRASTLPMPLVLPRMRAGSKNNKSSFQNTK